MLRKLTHKDYTANVHVVVKKQVQSTSSDVYRYCSLGRYCAYPRPFPRGIIDTLIEREIHSTCINIINQWTAIMYEN